jgi:hypothetical protein
VAHRYVELRDGVPGAGFMGVPLTTAGCGALDGSGRDAMVSGA